MPGNTAQSGRTTAQSAGVSIITVKPPSRLTWSWSTSRFRLDTLILVPSVRTTPSQNAGVATCLARALSRMPTHTLGSRRGGGTPAPFGRTMPTPSAGVTRPSPPFSKVVSRVTRDSPVSSHVCCVSVCTLFDLHVVLGSRTRPHVTRGPRVSYFISL